MNFLKNELARESDLKRNSLWYSIGTFTFAVSSVLLLLVVTRLQGPEAAGVFSIGWAVCQLMYTVGLFGTRNFQVADIDNRYDDAVYFRSKIFTIVSMLAGCIIYSFVLRLSLEKTLVSFLLTLLMGAETIGDVLAGFLQKRERLDLSGKSYFFRILSYDLLFFVLLLLTGNLVLAIGAACLLSTIWLLTIDYGWVKMIGYTPFTGNYKMTLQLLKECFPIFFSAFLTNYIVNIPKNSIELYLTTKMQSIYNILFMPSAIITLFMSFVLVPMYTMISESWSKKDLVNFRKIIYRILGMIIGLTVLFAVAGYFMGIPILSWVYKVELSAFRPQFTLLILGGGINSLATFLVYLLTVFKKQRLLIYAYLLTALAATITSNTLVRESGITGAAVIYLIAVILIGCCLVVFTLYNYKKMSKT